MRVLVTGASGYVGSRLVPALLAQGHEVRAMVRDAESLGRFAWAADVEVAIADVRDRGAVGASVRGMDAVYFLVHGLGGADFATQDRRGATVLATEARFAGVARIVYLGGLVPDAPAERLSDHLASRTEVEAILTGSGVRTVALRAAVIIGSGSTSFEILRQVAERIPVQAVPGWMTSRVQPIALVDVVAVLVAALTAPTRSRSYDIGGPDTMPYPDLMAEYAEMAGLPRSWLEIPGLPTEVVGRALAVLTDLPGSTVAALVESLHHDMVCGEADFIESLLPAGYQLLPVRTAIHRALAGPDLPTRPEELDPMGPLPGDPEWGAGGRRTLAGRLTGLLDQVTSTVLAAARTTT